MRKIFYFLIFVCMSSLFIGGMSFGQSDNMVVDEDGNVGIGLEGTVPNAKLEVKGSGNTGVTAGLIIKDKANNVNVIVKDNGNVGIGTDTPDTDLDVKGKIKTERFVIIPRRGTPNNIINGEIWLVE